MKKRESRHRKPTEKMKTKLAGMFVLILLALFIPAVKLIQINLTSGNEYKKQVMFQAQSQYDSTIIPYKRGDIVDRNNNLLATDIKVYNVILDCSVAGAGKEIDPVIDALNECFGVEKDLVRALLTNDETKKSPYQILKRHVSMDEKKKFEEMTTLPEDKKELEKIPEKEKERIRSIRGVWFEEDYKRIYPNDSLACDLIGFTNPGNTADWGLEGQYNSTLNGVEGRKAGYYRGNSGPEQNIIDPENGNTVVSTIDINIQKVVEKYIEAFMQSLSGGPFSGPDGTNRGAGNIGVIVADPRDGTILAMAENDPYDLNDPRNVNNLLSEEQVASIKSLEDEEERKSAMNEAIYKQWRNFCITDTYEPGSVVKPITVAAALESGSIAPDDTFYCDGFEQVADRKIKCAAYPDAHGTQTLGEVIQNSCNDALMEIGRKMGKETMIRYQDQFNFGRKTGIDLPGESVGLIYNEDTMNETELATTSFGQGFSCTMIQEVAALSACINGGNYYEPHTVSRIQDENKVILEEKNANLKKKIISEEVSAEIREYMGMSVESGTSYKAKVPGYSMGGKTGTAEKLPRGNVKYLVSFAGFAPLNDPEVLIYVVVDEPNVKDQASSTYAQYIAQAIFAEIFPYLGIYPDERITDELRLWRGFNGVERMDGTIIGGDQIQEEPVEESESSEESTEESTDESTEEGTDESTDESTETEGSTEESASTEGDGSTEETGEEEYSEEEYSEEESYE